MVKFSRLYFGNDIINDYSTDNEYMGATEEITIIRWGIIGLGAIADKFAQDLMKVSHAELYAVASRSNSKAISVASKYTVKRYYDTYESLVQDNNVDAVYIATPHSFHFEHTILCLKHKKAVLCEKPFAMNLLQVKEMIRFAKEQNTLLMEGLWTSFLPHYQFVLEFINNNTLGSLVQLEADFGFIPVLNFEGRLLNKQLGGGSLLDIGIYPIYAALSSLGIPENIEAQATFFDNGTDSSCKMIFHYGQAKAMLTSTLLAQTPTEAVFTFEKGTLKINSRFHQPTTVTLMENNREEVFDFNYETLGYSYEITHFNNLLRNGKTESDIMTFEFFSTNLIKILDKVRGLIGLNYEL